jgi:hypothetical protein
MSKIKEGMSEAEVLALLGRPDDIRTQRDPGGISTTNTKEIWRYGTSGHLTTATLGQVYIDDGGRVQYFYGKGDPPQDNLFDEKELRRLLTALGQVPSYNDGWRYNPRKVIQAVNLLQPLGKEKALAVIKEFLRVMSHFHDDGREGTFLVLRTLFEVPEDPGYMPRMHVGAPSVPEPQDKRLLPRFPIALEQDIPFLVNAGYSLSGRPEPPESHLDYFRKHGQFRAKLLVPSDRPFEVLEAFAKSPRWVFKEEKGLNDTERGRHYLTDQILRLIDSVYRVEPDMHGNLLPRRGRDAQERRKKIIDEATNLKIRWEPKGNRYTFLDGKTLPEPEVKQYRRETWQPEVPGREVKVILERQDRRFLSISVQETFEVGKPGPKMGFKVIKAGSKGKPITEFQTGQGRIPTRGGTDVNTTAGARAFSSSNRTVEVDEGTELQVELSVDGKTQTSPTYEP